MTKTKTATTHPSREHRRQYRETWPAVETFEFRAGNENEAPKLIGVAARTGATYHVEDYAGGFEETIAPGAFTRTLADQPDVVLLVDHGGQPLARTTSGTLALRETEQGLEIEAALDTDDPDVAKLVPKLRRGDLSQMSIAFRVNKQEWNEDYTERTIKEINLARGDVSVVTFPASPTTEASLRAALADPAARELLLRELRAAEDEEADPPDEDEDTPADPPDEDEDTPDEDDEEEEEADDAYDAAEEELTKSVFDKLKEVLKEAEDELDALAT